MYWYRNDMNFCSNTLRRERLRFFDAMTRKIKILPPERSKPPMIETSLNWEEHLSLVG